MYQQSGRRFADYYLAFVQHHVLDFGMLDGELNNLLHALILYSDESNWLEAAHLLQALGSYLDTRGYWAEHQVWLEQLLANWDGVGDTTVEIEILEALATITSSRGDWARSKELYERVIHLSESSRDDLHLARAYSGLGLLQLNQSQIRDTRISWERAISIADRIGDEIQASVIRYLLQSPSLAEPNKEPSYDMMQQAVRLVSAIASDLGDIGKHLLIQLQAMIHFARGEDDQANRLYLEALELARKEGDQVGIALTLYQLGRVAHRRNNLSLALDYYQESLKIAGPMGDRAGLVALYPAIGVVYLQWRHFDLARLYLEQAVALQRRTREPYELADALFWLGYALANTGSPDQAKQVFEESLSILTGLGSPHAEDVRAALSQLEGVMARENS